MGLTPFVRKQSREDMKVLAVGGGSGGHVTPLAAVLAELRKQQKNVEIRFWCDRKFAPQARSIIANFDASVPVQTVWAGKLRRYSHLTLLQHFTIPSVLFPNIRDAFLAIVGIVQSIFRLIAWRPDVVFSKGGYVSLPVGWAAALLRIPVVIHDSDAHPGLTNRLLAPIAKSIATGVSTDYYSYPKNKTTYVGIPIDAEYQPFDAERKAAIKRELGFDPKRPMVVIVGGGLGAKSLNDAAANQLHAILEHANVVLVSGAAQYDEMRSLTPQDDPRFILRDFVSKGMVDLQGAADIVASRAGATAILELAALAKPVILVPSKRLVWQIKHAKVYADEHAVVLLDEDRFTEPDDKSLSKTVIGLLANAQIQERLSKNIHRLARPHAARDMAAMIIRAARKRR